MADPYLGQEYIDEGQKSAGVAVNDFLFMLAANVHLAVISATTTAPPGSPVEGDIYLVPPSGATGAWTGLENHIVPYHGGAWVDLIPKEGWTAWVKDSDARFFFDGSAWVGQEPDWVQTPITAFAGGGQGSATQLLAQKCHVTTVASAGDSVKLLSARVGLEQWVFNETATSCNVFPATGDDIDGGATNAAVAVAAGKGRVFCAKNATSWRTVLGA